MSLPILTVIGATGTQGGSVVSAILQSDTTPAYHIRALTSNTSSPAATRLAKDPNVTVVHADINSVQSLEEAFKDSHAIFANTIFPFEKATDRSPEESQSIEEQHGLNIVHAAAKIASLKHLVWSTLPDTVALTNGAFHLPHFMAKLAAEKFIKDPANGLAEKSSFLQVGMYGGNIVRPPYRPIWMKRANKFVFFLPCSPDAPMPFIADEETNVGLFVQAILNQPEKTLGRFVLGSAEILSCRDWATSFSTALQQTGKYPNVEAVFVDCGINEFNQLWGSLGVEIGQMMEYYRAYGMEGWKGHIGSDPILTAADLGIEKKLKSTVDRLVRIDTNWYEHN